MFLINLILLILCGLLSPAWSYEANNSNGIKVVYPKSESSIEAVSTFLVGQVPINSNLTCNGQSVRVNQSGFFAHVVPLHYGANHFLLLDSDNGKTNDSRIDWTVFRKPPPKPISAQELKMEVQKPNYDLGVTSGNIISFVVRATPQAVVTVQLGPHQITLTPVPESRQSSNNDVAYGKTYRRYDLNESDLYKGSYRIADTDHFASIHPSYKLTCHNGNLSVLGKSAISTVEHLYIARTIKAPTVVRLGPGLARTTPLVEGVRVVIDGWSGENMRCVYSPNRHVWITKQNLIMESEKELPHNMLRMDKINPDTLVPQAVAQTINILDDSYGEKVCLPLSERLPYQIEQKLNPNCLIMRVYGVSADTDWITNEPKSNDKEGSIIDHVSWRQAEDNVYEVQVYLSGKRQWGYHANYDGTTLCLSIKHPPTTTADGTLRGLKICLDPGHGGSETGSIGCSGIHESQINFEIADKVKTYLEDLGATVIMTRNVQSDGPSLDDRVKIATDNQADFLVSIHNNALPDGRDPLKEHGTSSYWYHPQSMELAASLKKSVKEASGFLDLGSRYQNLALARATAMPSVLLEIGFMINPDEFTNLIDPQFQSKIAESIANGIKHYFYANNDSKQ